jgi:hypothetical protein
VLELKSKLARSAQQLCGALLIAVVGKNVADPPTKVAAFSAAILDHIEHPPVHSERSRMQRGVGNQTGVAAQTVRFQAPISYSRRTGWRVCDRRLRPPRRWSLRDPLRSIATVCFICVRKCPIHPCRLQEARAASWTRLQTASTPTVRDSLASNVAALIIRARQAARPDETVGCSDSFEIGSEGHIFL